MKIVIDAVKRDPNDVLGIQFNQYKNVVYSMNNMLKLSTNLSNWMGSSYFPIILISGAGLIILFKLK